MDLMFFPRTYSHRSDQWHFTRATWALWDHWNGYQSNTSVEYINDLERHTSASVRWNVVRKESWCSFYTAFRVVEVRIKPRYAHGSINGCFAEHNIFVHNNMRMQGLTAFRGDWKPYTPAHFARELEWMNTCDLVEMRCLKWGILWSSSWYWLQRGRK